MRTISQTAASWVGRGQEVNEPTDTYTPRRHRMVASCASLIDISNTQTSIDPWLGNEYNSDTVEAFEFARRSQTLAWSDPMAVAVANHSACAKTSIS
jgi:hypothetical protein